MASKEPTGQAVLVVGLGRFGSSIAEALDRMGHEVLAVDKDPAIVQEWSGRLTHVVEADSATEEALRQIGAADFSIAVVGIGTSIESSVLTTVTLSDLGIKQIWAKAITPAHGKILERIGATKVVYPERDAGERVAHLVSGTLMDFIEFDDGFAIVKMAPPQETRGFTLAESQVRAKYGVTVVGVKSPNQDFTYAVASTKISAHDLLIVSGQTRLIERFAARP
ncbi:potassium channel family protein [Angustibacter sp. McL0619]|uniref:potassium channel family protein n=1 Tax=Angustibacter sp. McL0619 TaxID=3415676 RepID=UPI003CF537B2